MDKSTVNTADLLDYAIMLVHEYAEAHGLTDAQAFRYMWRYRAIQDILDAYSAAHTLPTDDVCDTISRICRSRGGLLS